jgi:hypothetical protein
MINLAILATRKLEKLRIITNVMVLFNHFAVARVLHVLYLYPEVGFYTFYNL